MPSYLFASLFLLLVCSFSFALAHNADSGESDSTIVQNVEIFKENCDIKLDHRGGDNNDANNKIKNVDNVFVVMADDLVVVVAEAKYTQTGGGDAYNFVAAYPKTTDDWDEEIFKQGGDDICSKWNTQLASTNTDGNSFSTLKNVVYDKKNKNIYLLVVEKPVGSEEWKHNLFVGNTSTYKEREFIQWDETKKTISKVSKDDKFKKKLTGNFIQSSSIDNSAFVISDQKIVFVLRTTNQKDKNVIAFLELKINDKQPELNFLHVNETTKNCYPYFLSWGEKKVMIPTNCDSSDENYQNVKESSDMNNWKESPDLFYYLFDFLKDKTSFTTAFINGTNVLLFAEQNKKQCSKTEEGKNCFTFWFSNGNRTYNVGQIVLETNEDVVSSSIIYAKDKLFFLVHQKAEGGNKKFILTRLDKQLENITTTLEKWSNADQIASKLCGPESSDSKATCAASLPTNGLVGFLSNRNDSTNEWIDEYLYVNATITGGASFEKGLKCDGERQGAKWPVDKDDNDQPYKFTKYGFTLLATLKIGGNAAEGKVNSLLGLVLKKEPKRFGLWCSGGNWAVNIGEDGEKKVPSPEVSCKHNNIYFVAFILEKNRLSVYVDGQLLQGLDSGKITIDSSKNIAYFYFGSDNNAQAVQSHVTITNVLLYNRPFTAEEIMALKEIKNVVGSTTEDSAARVGVVGVLCFMLFGVFTLLGRYVY